MLGVGADRLPAILSLMAVAKSSTTKTGKSVLMLFWDALEGELGGCLLKVETQEQAKDAHCLLMMEVCH